MPVGGRRLWLGEESARYGDNLLSTRSRDLDPGEMGCGLGNGVCLPLPRKLEQTFLRGELAAFKGELFGKTTTASEWEWISDISAASESDTGMLSSTDETSLDFSETPPTETPSNPGSRSPWGRGEELRYV